MHPHSEGELRAQLDELRARVSQLERSTALGWHREDRASMSPGTLLAQLPQFGLATAPGRVETILLVEDAERVRQVIGEILTMEGYDVIEAWSGGEALEIIERHKGPIHLVLTDVVMPRMSGLELAERLAPLRPSAKVVYMSGYTDPASLPRGVLEPGTIFLEKPFTAETLARKVRESLDVDRCSAA